MLYLCIVNLKRSIMNNKFEIGSLITDGKTVARVYGYDGKDILVIAKGEGKKRIDEYYVCLWRDCEEDTTPNMPKEEKGLTVRKLIQTLMDQNLDDIVYCGSSKIVGICDEFFGQPINTVFLKTEEDEQ